MLPHISGHARRQGPGSRGGMLRRPPKTQAKSPRQGELSAANIYSRNALTADHSAACFFMNPMVSSASRC